MNNKILTHFFFHRTKELPNKILTKKQLRFCHRVTATQFMKPSLKVKRKGKSQSNDVVHLYFVIFLNKFHSQIIIQESQIRTRHDRHNWHKTPTKNKTI